MRATLSLTLAIFRNLSRYRTEFLTSTLSPLFWVIPALLLTRYADALGLRYNFKDIAGVELSLAATYFLVGATYWNYVEGVWSIALGLRVNMRLGTLESLWCTPAPRISFMISWSAGRLLAVTLHSILALGLLIFLSLVNLEDIRFERPTLAVIVLGFSVLASYGFAFLLVGLTLKFKDAESIISILGNAAPLLGGVIFPVMLLPGPLRIVSYLFPFTYGADALRGLILGSKTLLPLYYEVGGTVVMGVFFAIVGWQAFVWLESKARMDGLENF